MKFFANQPANPAELKGKAQAISQAIADYQADQVNQAALQDRIAGLQQEEADLTAKLGTAAPTKTRSVAHDLSAVRIELEELKRRAQPGGASELLLLEIRKLAADAGNALATLYGNIPSDIKAKWVTLTQEFFTRPEVTAQFAGQTDVHRAFLGLLQSATRQLNISDPDGLVAEATRRLSQLEAALAGEPVMEYNSPLASAA